MDAQSEEAPFVMNSTIPNQFMVYCLRSIQVVIIQQQTLLTHTRSHILIVIAACAQGPSCTRQSHLFFSLFPKSVAVILRYQQYQDSNTI